MRFLRYSLILALLFGGGAEIIFASTTNLSTDPVYAEGPFLFWCKPYLHSFEENKHYKPIPGPCIYSIPSPLSGSALVGLYRGEVGSSTFVTGDREFGGATLVQLGGNVSFSTVSEGEPLFAAVYDSSLNQGGAVFHDYLLTGGEIPSGAIADQNYFIRTWRYGAKPVSEFEPVIIIPGILGSWEKDGEWVLDPITHIYDNLVDTLLANGYIEDQTLFKFPYDWRKSNVITAGLLENKIKEIKDICNCSYVDLVAHSMGGLVASQYVVSNTNTNDVDQMVMLGVPMAGAPKAYKTWESGEVDFGNTEANLIMQRVFEREARDFGFNNVFEYIRANVSSVRELLPIYDYLDTQNTHLIYPSGYPENSWLYNMLFEFPTQVFNRVRVNVAIGEASTTAFITPSSFSVKPSTQLPLWEHGEIIYTDYNSGDGTVPWYSAVFMSGPDKEFSGVNHTELVSQSAGYVFESLAERTSETTIENIFDYRDADYLILIQHLAPSSGDFRFYAETVGRFILQTNPAIRKILTIVIYSPIDVEVIAPDGKRIGKDIATGATLNEIPNAIYSGAIEEYEHVIIVDPLPGIYVVKTKGTGSGAYTIATGYADTATTSVSFVSGTTTMNQVIENTLTLSSTTTAVTIKENILPPPTVLITPATCVKDMQLAYKNKWIGKKSVHDALVADCKLLGVLFVARDKAKTSFVRRGAITTIKLTLDHMDKLAKDKSNKQEAVDLIIKNTKWFREHEL